MDFFLTHVPPAIRCQFTVGRHQGPDGVAPTLVHYIKSLKGKQLDAAFESARAAQNGKGTDDERDAAYDDALCSIWDALVERVDTAPSGDYGKITIDGADVEVKDLRGDQLRAAFRGEYLPADLDGARRKEAVEEMREHKIRAVNTYWKVCALDSTFRLPGR